MARTKSSRCPRMCPPIQGLSSDQDPVLDDAQEKSPSAYLNLNQLDTDAPEGPTTDDALSSPTTDAEPVGQSSEEPRRDRGPSKMPEGSRFSRGAHKTFRCTRAVQDSMRVSLKGPRRNHL